MANKYIFVVFICITNNSELFVAGLMEDFIKSECAGGVTF